MAGTDRTAGRTQQASSAKERLLRLGHKCLTRLVPENRAGDRVFSYLLFLICHGRAPTRRLLFNDVLYRIKTTDEILDPMRVFVSDKELAKLYVKAVVGDDYNVPTLDVIRSADAADRYHFPPDCCIKPTHASGQTILRRHGEQLDLDRVKGWFMINHYRKGREANYKMLRPKVIVEPLVFGRSNVEDFKFFCVHGAPRLVQVDMDRFGDHRRKYYDPGWNELDFSIIYPKYESPIPKPGNLPEMLSVAARLSAAFSFVRIDLYSDGSKTLVGEITNCSENAGARFIPPQAERFASELLFRPGDAASITATAGRTGG